MRSMSRRGVTLIEWIVLLVAAFTLLALAVPAWVQSRRHADVAGCQGHLKALHAASLSAPKDPKVLGMAYWTRLPVAADVLRCPMAAASKRACDYLAAPPGGPPPPRGGGGAPGAPPPPQAPVRPEPRGAHGPDRLRHREQPRREGQDGGERALQVGRGEGPASAGQRGAGPLARGGPQ